MLSRSKKRERVKIRGLITSERVFAQRITREGFTGRSLTVPLDLRGAFGTIEIAAPRVLTTADIVRAEAVFATLSMDPKKAITVYA